MKIRTSRLSSFQLRYIFFALGLVAIALLFSPAVSRHRTTARQLSDNPLTVHEWGTFTSIVGPDGQAMDWLPRTGSTDLPSFVEHLGDVNFKGGLRGTTRMETPVLYFYSPRETSVSVHVSLAKGLITEWYPRASSLASVDPRKIMTLYDARANGGITWNSVHIQPGSPADFPSDSTQNHYYAARQTSSAPLSVDTAATGSQRERFLFYRGVSAFSPPLTATISAGDTVLLQNHFSEAVPSVILFERRGGRLGYRVLGPLSDQASINTPSTLDGSLESLFSDLAGVLVSQGLYPEEAHAMLETWRNSWFEEGARLIYIVPQPFVDSVLPLRILPSPVVTVRVFVGRLELITPATQRAVESAFATGNRAALVNYSRFLDPILRTIIANSTDPARTQRLEEYLQSVYLDLHSKSSQSVQD